MKTITNLVVFVQPRTRQLAELEHLGKLGASRGVRCWIVAVGLQDARMGDTGGRLVLTGADPVMLQSLVEMGFPESDARRGLAARPNNLEVLSFSVPCSATS